MDTEIGLLSVGLIIKLWLMTNSIETTNECIVINTQKNDRKCCFLEQKRYNKNMNIKTKVYALEVLL